MNYSGQEAQQRLGEIVKTSIFLSRFPRLPLSNGYRKPQAERRVSFPGLEF